MKKPNSQNDGTVKVNITVFDPNRYAMKARKPVRRANGEVYLSPNPVELYSFDESYLRRLEADDPVTVAHFVNYFTTLLRIKLRSRRMRGPEVDDITQETFLRVQAAIRKGEIRQPERLGAFVNSVCNNVLLENYRDFVRNDHVDVDCVDVPDTQNGTEDTMFRHERQQSVHIVLRKLTPKDRAILRAHYLEEVSKDDICHKFHVDRGYLRVLLHRAKGSFKAHYKIPKPPKARGQGAK